MSAGSAGTVAETAALDFLETRNLLCLDRNFRCRSGEIDLVMRDADCLVFVEVRYRRHSRYGTGAATVTRSKQSRLTAAARYFLMRHRHLRGLPCRFDVIAATGELDQLSLRWIRNAFTAT